MTLSVEKRRQQQQKPTKPNSMSWLSAQHHPSLPSLLQAITGSVMGSWDQRSPWLNWCVAVLGCRRGGSGQGQATALQEEILQKATRLRAPITALFMHTHKQLHASHWNLCYLSVKPPHTPCCALANIYSKSVTLTIKSEAALSDSFNGCVDSPSVNNDANTNLFIDLLFVPFILAHSFSLSEEKS